MVLKLWSKLNLLVLLSLFVHLAIAEDSPGHSENTAFQGQQKPEEKSRTSRKLGGDDYEDLGWSSEGTGGLKGGGLNLLKNAAGSLGQSELLGKVKDLLSNIGGGLEGLKGGLGGGKGGGKGGKGGGGKGGGLKGGLKGGLQEEAWGEEEPLDGEWLGDEEVEEEWDPHGNYGEIEHEQDSPYPNIPVIDVPGKKKVGPPLTFGNYNRMGVGSFVDALAVCVATVVWLTFFGLVLPLFYGGQLGRKRRSVDDPDMTDGSDNGKLNKLTELVTNVLTNGDCLEYAVCRSAETFPDSSRRILKFVSFATQIPAEGISRPASRIHRGLTTESCDIFQCNRR